MLGLRRPPIQVPYVHEGGWPFILKPGLPLVVLHLGQSSLQFTVCQFRTQSCQQYASAPWNGNGSERKGPLGELGGDWVLNLPPLRGGKAAGVLFTPASLPGLSHQLLGVPPQQWEKAEQVQLHGAGRSSSSRARGMLPGAKEGYGPPPQKLGGPQAIPSSQALHPYKKRHQLAN